MVAGGPACVGGGGQRVQVSAVPRSVQRRRGSQRWVWSVATAPLPPPWVSFSMQVQRGGGGGRSARAQSSLSPVSRCYARLPAPSQAGYLAPRHCGRCQGAEAGAVRLKTPAWAAFTPGGAARVHSHARLSLLPSRNPASGYEAKERVACGDGQMKQSPTRADMDSKGTNRDHPTPPPAWQSTLTWAGPPCVFVSSLRSTFLKQHLQLVSVQLAAGLPPCGGRMRC